MADVQRSRPRLSRTFSRARWTEYERLLTGAMEHGYTLVSLESWLLEGEGEGCDRLMLMRHDVDQCPGAALRMAAIEERFGITSTWYFRWRTANAHVIERLRHAGNEIGLHYETLSRVVKQRGGDAASDALLAECRGLLGEELAAFAARHGRARSACPHGDSSIPTVRNGVLLRNQDLAPYGIEVDGNEGIYGRRLGKWLTDRSHAEGRWIDGSDPHELLAGGVSPILCLTHPNNWVSGGGLWVDRIVGAVLPDAGARTSRLARTGTDRPPLAVGTA